MFSVKFIAVVFGASFLFTGGTSSGCHSKSANSQSNKSISSTMDDGELRVLAEGSLSPITTPFVAVVRDAETYAALRGLAGNLPALNGEFFRSNVVIAAFLGERNTGGYGIAISHEQNGQIRVAEKAPRKDMMVTQMITSPFKVVSLATDGAPSVQLSLDERFKQRTELYRINSGSFTMSGGFAGRSDTFQLAGKIQVNRIGSLITIGFAVASSGTARERMLRDVATGLVKENEFSIQNMSHGSLVDPPSGHLRVSGRFVERNRLILDFDTGTVTVPDGFSGRGNIEAQMVTASAN